MTDRNDPSSRSVPPPPPDIENAAPEDLACLQSAVEGWQHERDSLLARSQAVETDAEAKRHHAERRLHQAVSQLEAVQRNAHAVRVRLEADAQAARTRAEQAQQALGTTQAVAEQLRNTNAELSTALDATQWRLTQLETENEALHRELNELSAERNLGGERHAAVQSELDALRQTHERTHAAAADEMAALRAELTAARNQVAVLATRTRAQDEEIQAGLQLREQLDQMLAELRAEHLEKEAQQRDERDAASARLRSLEDALNERDGIISRLRGAEDELQRLQVVHTGELTAWHEISAQREADLVAARDALATQLAEEREGARDVRDHAAALTARLQEVEAGVRAAEEQRQELTEHLAAAHRERDRIEAQSQSERSRFEGDLQLLQTAHADAMEAAHQRTQQDAAERETLASRIALLEQELRQRDGSIELLRAGISRLEEQKTQARQAASEAGRRRDDEWRATHKTLQDELQSARRALADAEAARQTVDQSGRTLEERLLATTAELNEMRARTEAAAALAQEKADAYVAAEQRATDSEQRYSALAEQLDGSQKQATQAQHRLDAMTAQIAELENERSPLKMRVDELTALTGQLERECERLRRDRGSSEETRRLKADNARLEAKIVELDRQRGEAVQRHSAAVAGYMVELNQRSEALRARDAELQKTAEELTLVKQSCEDAMGELEVQRREHAALDRQLAELRATPASSVKPLAAEAKRAAAPVATVGVTPPAAAQPSVSKSAKQPAQGDTIAGPVTVVHLEENKMVCDAAREVVSRRPDSSYTNTLEATIENASGSRLLAVNFLGRAHDPVAAILSFIAADTYHRSVLAYCADGANGFSFGMADFFAQPVDPDACVARLLESVGTIQRLLVVTENFSVVGALRGVLSRMRSSVSAALDLRQVIDLIPMVEPDVVLVDLALPRGEGLRLVSRLRSDPKTRDLALGILLTPPGNPAELRQHALRAARDLPMSAADLAQIVAERLGAKPAAVAATRLQQTADARA